MIPGYNHNISYKDQIYHIQTEDSGVENPHIITHLFVGGNIIRTVKTSYADIVNSERRNEMVVELMQDQHKSMLKGLIKGQLDNDIAARSANAGKLNGPAPLNVEAGAQGRASFGVPSTPTAPATPPATPPPIPAPPQTPAAVPPVPPPPQPPAQPEAELAPTLASAFFGDAPVAPGNEKVIDAETLARAFDSDNESAVDSIFGEDLISEKSLDEVILSYLAEDMTKE